MSRFRELVIESASRIKLRNNNFLVETVDGDQEISLNQVNSVVVGTQQCIISAPAIIALQQANVNLVLTDKHHQPVILQQRDRILAQSSWRDSVKLSLWQLIVKSKMQNQILLSHFSDFQIPDIVANSDEALLAKKYFHRLFGQDFRRDFVTGLINSALNYGYTVLTSQIATEIASHGYSNVLGIHHHSFDNRLNLACDFVEPWRMVVDQYVVNHQHDQFDQLYRQNLVDLLNLPINYNSIKYQTVSLAIRQYVDDCLSILNGSLSLPKVGVRLLDHASISHV